MLLKAWWSDPQRLSYLETGWWLQKKELHKKRKSVFPSTLYVCIRIWKIIAISYYTFISLVLWKTGINILASILTLILLMTVSKIKSNESLHFSILKWTDLLGVKIKKKKQSKKHCQVSIFSITYFLSAPYLRLMLLRDSRD